MVVCCGIWLDLFGCFLSCVFGCEGCGGCVVVVWWWLLVVGSGVVVVNCDGNFFASIRASTVVVA